MIADRYRDRHVHADHAHVHPAGEFARGVSVARKDRNAIAVLMLAWQSNRVFEVVGAHDLQHRAENLFLVAFHPRRNAVDQGRTDEEAVLMPLQCEPAAIDHDFCTFGFSRIDPAFDPRFVLGRYNRAVMRVRIVRHTNAQCVDCRDQLFAQTIGGVFANRYDDRQCHAPLACAAKCRACQIIDHLIQIRVRHHNAVVFRAAECLYALCIRTAA